MPKKIIFASWKFQATLKNIFVLSVVAMLLIHNVFVLYVEILFAGNIQWKYYAEEKGLPDELSFTETQSDVAYQFIFDSEFKNINATNTVFEEHKNLNSDSKSNLDHIIHLALPECGAGIGFDSLLASYFISLPNSCKQELHSNLFSFRI